MCGISCVIVKNEVSNLPQRLKSMTDSIIHRGPDDEGYTFFSKTKQAFPFSGIQRRLKEENLAYVPSVPISEARFADNDISIAFGFRRLSIIDLSSRGHQPMCSSNNRYWIVFNGEIYNYLELKSELQKHGYSFQSDSDTEVILAAYDRWGPECLNMFNGMWAFVLYDTLNDVLFVSRDRYGIKPLYYYMDDGHLLFASEIKQFLAFGSLAIAPNVEKISSDFPFDTMEYGTETAFTNVHRFPNGHYAMIQMRNFPSVLSFNKYYTVNLFDSEGTYEFSEKKAMEYAEEYYALLDDAVKLRLRSDVPVGTCFSGGLDSSSIVYLVNKHLQRNNAVQQQRTFSLVFSSPETKYCDESNYINLLAKDLNLQSFTIEPTTEDVLRRYRDMVYVMDTPQHSTLASYVFTYQLVRNHGVTVTLDGQGADELQAGYLYYLVHHLATVPLGRLLSEFKLVTKNPGAMNPALKGAILNAARRLGGRSIVDNLAHKRKSQIDPYQTLNSRLLFDFERNLKTLFHYGDRGSMLSSIESRFPMMDFRLVNFWFNLPASYKISQGYTKYIARLAFNGKLPDGIVWRRDKKGWEMPQQVWIQNGLGKEITLKITDNRFLKETGLSLPDKYLSSSNKDHRYWKLPIKLYNLALWHEVFFGNE